MSQNRRKAKTWTKNEERKKKRERSCSSWVCEWCFEPKKRRWKTEWESESQRERENQERERERMKERRNVSSDEESESRGLDPIRHFIWQFLPPTFFSFLSGDETWDINTSIDEILDTRFTHSLSKSSLLKTRLHSLSSSLPLSTFHPRSLARFSTDHSMDGRWSSQTDRLTRRRRTKERERKKGEGKEEHRLVVINLWGRFVWCNNKSCRLQHLPGSRMDWKSEWVSNRGTESEKEGENERRKNR